MEVASIEQLSAALAGLRKKLGVSQVQIADLAGVKQSSYGAWELGKSEPGALSLAKLAKAAGISTDELLFDRTSDELKSAYPNHDFNHLSDDQKRRIGRIAELCLEILKEVGEEPNNPLEMIERFLADSLRLMKQTPPQKGALPVGTVVQHDGDMDMRILNAPPAPESDAEDEATSAGEAPPTYGAAETGSETLEAKEPSKEWRRGKGKGKGRKKK